ncbi:MAG: NAD+ synthase [Planctomycetes bacterium]|nr:NAD+ synthase [Planctomycetota bacterium]
MRIALAQINPTVGDLVGNADLIRAALAEGARAGASLVVFPELALTGYPPQDLLHRPRFLAATQRTLEALAAETGEVAALVGYPAPREPGGRRLANAAAFLRHGAIRTVVHKRLLPTYDVFDEDRYFEPGADEQPVAELDGVKIGVSICEDMWNPADIGLAHRLHKEVDPIADLARRADLLLNLSASPYDRGKPARREALIQGHARRHRKPLLFVNQVGGNDSLVFDGGSCAVDANGALQARAPRFESALWLVEVDPQEGTVEGELTPVPATEAEEVYAALVLGTRDYTRKCGFRQVLLGLSGGIDSALTCAVAVDALGAENVLGVRMPSRFSSQGSLDDAQALADALGIACETVPIEPMFQSCLESLAGPFGGKPWDVTEENIQARLRGIVLMGLSNKTGRLLLTTGNKSELATGYCTLYGDMAGGLAVISDVPKTLVYAISRALNAERVRIPWSTIEKPPSAELAPDQLDSDSLPPYEVLDAILERLIERHQDAPDVVAAGFEAEVVERIVRLLDRTEYKRRQAAPGLRVTTKAFGAGRAMPIAKRVTGIG